MNSARLFVTGGDDFIGSHVVMQSLRLGVTMKVLELPDAPLLIYGGNSPWLVCNAYIVHRALKDAQRLYHLAGNPNLWAHGKREFQYINFEGACTVIKEAAKQNLKALVYYTSSESTLTGNARRDICQ